MKLILHSTKTTPFIDFKDGYLQIQGNSIPADIPDFYGRLLNCLKVYSKNPQTTTTVDISFDNMNCYSKRSMMILFRMLERLYLKGNKISINWYYPDDDDSLLELGLIYHSLIKVPFNFVKNKKRL